MLHVYPVVSAHVGQNIDHIDYVTLRSLYDLWPKARKWAGTYTMSYIILHTKFSWVMYKTKSFLILDEKEC